MSPEHSKVPSPPLAGYSPAAANADPVFTEQLMPAPSWPVALKVTTAASGSAR
jgi:hypothetical protein